MRIVILGFGDVVRARLLLALDRARARWPISTIKIHDIAESGVAQAAALDISNAQAFWHAGGSAAIAAAANSDLVFVCTPREEHSNSARVLARQGIYVACEKPIT